MAGGSPFPNPTAEEAAELIPHARRRRSAGSLRPGAAKAVPNAAASLSTTNGRGRCCTRSASSAAPRPVPAWTTPWPMPMPLSWCAPYQSAALLPSASTTAALPSWTCTSRTCRSRCCSASFGPVDVAVIEATEITSDGRVYLTTSIGAAPTFLQVAKKVIIELNRHPARGISDMADIVVPRPPPPLSPAAFASARPTPASIPEGDRHRRNEPGRRAGRLRPAR